MVFVLYSLRVSADGISNQDFESGDSWIVRCREGRGPGAPRYAVGAGRDGSRGFRIGRSLEGESQDGCELGGLAQTFEIKGHEGDRTTVTFSARFLGADNEEATVSLTTLLDRRILCGTIPSSESFRKYRISADGCGATAWVKYFVVENRHPAAPDPTPLKQSTLLIDDVACECTPAGQPNAGADVDSLEDLCVIVAFPGPVPPRAGKGGWYFPDSPPGKESFRRGDADGSSIVNLTDAVVILDWLFRSGVGPGCEDTSDVNDDGVVNLTDAIFGLTHLFRGGAPPPPPFEECGRDRTEDTLSCDVYEPCM